jgi:hypothetical protein
MSKMMSLVVRVSILIASFLCMAHGQVDKKGWEKSITLPTGEVILDMSGEWDAISENYGQWSEYGTSQDVFTITQEGNSFVAIRVKGNAYMPAGTAGTRGELDERGFKRVSIITAGGPVHAEGMISEDGNKIIIDDGRIVRQTLTRK